MFDLNNLKTVNDTMGHSAGDQLILNFARLLRNVIPEKDFVGRYGGDEFMAVIYHTSQTEVEEILKCLCLEKDRLNNREDKMLIDYAYGWALSANDGKYTIQTLLDKADSYMYENKKLCKRYRLMSEVEFFSLITGNQHLSNAGSFYLFYQKGREAGKGSGRKQALRDVLNVIHEKTSCISGEGV